MTEQPDATPVPPTYRERMAELDAITAADIDTPHQAWEPRPVGPHQPPNYADRMALLEARITADSLTDAP
jgi:hypothetical protein